MFEVPEYVVGLPLFNLNMCIAFIIRDLRTQGYFTKYLYPNFLYISWDPIEISGPKQTRKEEAKPKTVRDFISATSTTKDSGKKVLSF
jgi:hypothetical protein